MSISVSKKLFLTKESNPGGTDAGVVIAWEVALNITQAFEGLLDFDLLGTRCGQRFTTLKTHFSQYLMYEELSARIN